MQLIGMLDSPYVRRVAIAFQFLELDFSHKSVSVFSQYEDFKNISSVVKAPSLVLENGSVLTDSNLILDYGLSLTSCDHKLMPNDINHRQHALELIGLALVACEKSIQIVYEHNLRPSEKLHEPWVARVTEQLNSALNQLEALYQKCPVSMTRDSIDLAAISTCVAWKFIQEMTPDAVDLNLYPTLRSISSKAERLEEFRLAPFGDHAYPVKLPN